MIKPMNKGHRMENLIKILYSRQNFINHKYRYIKYNLIFKKMLFLVLRLHSVWFGKKQSRYTFVSAVKFNFFLHYIMLKKLNIRLFLFYPSSSPRVDIISFDSVYARGILIQKLVRHHQLGWDTHLSAVTYLGFVLASFEK